MRTIRTAVTAIVVLVMGIVLIVISFGEMADYSKKGADFSTLTISDIREGMMIEGDLPYNYGSYEQIKKEKEKDGFGFYYLIPVGDDSTIGLYTAVDDLIAELDAQSDAYDSAEYLEDLENIAPVHFKGKVTVMDSEDKEYYRQALTDGFGLDDDYISEHCPYLYIKCIDTSGHPIILVVGIVCTVVGAVLFLLFIRRKMMGR